MNMEQIIPAAATAVSIGLGCGTCCSPVISMFLSTYVVSHSDGAKKGIISFLCFFLGKTISVVTLCVLSAIISRQFLSENGYIGSFNLRLASQIAMSAIGLIMAIRWVLEIKKGDCGGCKDCKSNKSETGLIPMITAGITYGITPCAPMLLMMGYCFTLPAALAGITSVVFCIASMISPAILLVAVTGALSKKMRAEIPNAVKWFRLASYLMLMTVPFITPV